MSPDDERRTFGARWRAARPGCGCGRPDCEGCALTPRTVFVLESELAWLVDLAGDDIPALTGGQRSLRETVFTNLPEVASKWAASEPGWLEHFRECVRQYVHRLGKPGPIAPQTLAEEVALRMAFAAARTHSDPDDLLPPDVADVLPALPGDYAWSRAEDAVGFSQELLTLYRPGPEGEARDALRPAWAWFDLR